VSGNLFTVVPELGEYLEWLNRSQPKEDVEKIRHAIKRSKPYGSEGRVSKAVAQFGLENTVRNPWRPGKAYLEAVKKSSVILSEAKNLLLSF
jgi:hypothetical protein